MLINSKNPLSSWADEIISETDIMLMLCNCQYAEAYGFLDAKPNKQVNDWYNIALCSYHTKLYDNCLHYLLKISTSDLKKPSLEGGLNPLQQKMLDYQIEHYLYFEQGISSAYVQRYPTLVQDSILRLKIACYVALALWDSIIKETTTYKASKYNDLKEALLLAENNKKQL